MLTLIGLYLSLLFHGQTYVHTVDRVSSSVTHIIGVTDEGQHGMCTGFVIAKHRELTAAHCAGTDMTADGLVATVLKTDKYVDLALLEVGTEKPALSFRDIPIARFEPLTAIGYAWGWKYLTVLGVRALLIDVQPNVSMAPGLFAQPGYIAGMSGGPVTDIDGHVVGIIQQTNEGVGFGVTVPLIKAFLLGT